LARFYHTTNVITFVITYEFYFNFLPIENQLLVSFIFRDIICLIEIDIAIEIAIENCN